MRPVKPIHVIGFGLFVFLAIALLSGQATSAAILAESTYPKIPAPVVTVPPTVPPPCQLAWRIMSTPDGFENDHLAGIDGLSPDSLWAVGYEGYEKAHYRTLTLHWDGSQWSRLPSPSPDLFSRLYSVDVVAEDDVWAVGQAGLFPNSGTLIMHWNGSAWSVVPSPSPGTNNYLAGV